MITLNSNDSLIGGKYDRIEIKGRNVMIKDVTVEGDGITLYSNYNCSGLTIDNCKFISHKNNAVKLIADSIGGVIKNVVFKNCVFEFARMGAEIQNHGNNTYKIDTILFENCSFAAIGDSNYRYGLSLTGYGRNAVIDNCSFSKTCVKGIELVGFSNVDIKESDISGSSYSFISSNARKMDHVNISDCKMNGMLRIYNCSQSVLMGCEIDASYVEIKNSDNITMQCNTVASTGHYSLLLNQASDCTVDNNVFNQKSATNWAVVRCYGKQSIANVITNNTVTRTKKVGKIFDEYAGAYGNKYEK